MAWGITGGIWQSVRLVATGEILVKDVFIEPKIADDSATFHLELENTGSASKSVQLVTMIRRRKILTESWPRQSEQYLCGPACASIRRRSKFLTPSTGLLTILTCIRPTLRSRGSDHWTSRFGMREFTIRDKQFYLNGKPVYLKATFFEGLYPNTNRLSRQPRDGRARDSVGQGGRIQHDSSLAAAAGSDVAGSGR